MRDLFFLSCGSFAVPAAAIEPRWSAAGARLSNTVAVAVRDSGDVVLVDAGWSEEACADPARAIGRVLGAVLGVRAKPGDAIATQLRALGVEPSRVKAIVATHLHLDHVGGARDFPDAELVTSREEIDAFRGGPRNHGYRARDLARCDRVRAVALDESPTYGFPRSADLFGDGEIVLCDVHGHTAGSVAVALRGPKGCYVHVGDAVYQSWEYGVSPAGPCRVARFTAWRRSDLARGYAWLRACEADPRRPTIVPSHDARVYETLPRGPASGTGP